jgi:subtilisin family serine protease
MLKYILINTFLITCAFKSLQAQSNLPDNWFNLDLATDKMLGVSSDKTYNELLKGKSGRTIVVAVIDGGVDPHHEDLKDVMWVNPGEIADNGIDDDQNGYIDDIYGWNFIGGTNGKNVHYDTYELTRVVQDMEKRYEAKNPDDLSDKEKKEYAKYLSYKKDIESQLDKANKNLAKYEQILTYVNFAMQMAKEALGEEAISQSSVDSLDDSKYGMVKSFLQDILPQLGTFDGNIDDLQVLISKDLQEALNHEKQKVDYGYNISFDPRNIVQDNYKNVSEKFYGNNDVKGPDAFHGTHVAGIIGAKRDNQIGINGVSKNVRIMAIRAVPDGDERDKDVANAILYAVDNGASIINMSFGKGFSPDEKQVEKAIKYAQKKDVLIVHAAGNSNQDNDVESNYPNAQFDIKHGLFSRKKATNWVEVGASTWMNDENLVASFSNYGRSKVDIFAPGHEIYSTAPDSKYEAASGTSMAAPVVSGVASILRAYFPEKSAKAIRNIIMQSASPYQGKVIKPGSNESIEFSSLSVTGGVINAYKAVKFAMEEEVKTKKKKVKSPVQPKSRA